MLKGTIEHIKHYSSYLDRDLAWLCWVGKRSAPLDPKDHLEPAIQWLCRAQDAFEGGGVARSYSLVYNRYFRRRGWIHPYPETTGYIIPTMFDYSHLVKSQEISDRANRMADWECEVQMKNGAVQGGTIKQPATPAIFNTGQVIFGWVRAYEETGSGKYLEAAVKAGKFLTAHQDRDGAWRKVLSDYASSEMESYTYNTRTAWALLQLSRLDPDSGFEDAAVRNIDFALGQQNENGWFRSNCLSDPSQPLLHTIAYCIRGILESGILLKKQIYIDRATRAADALVRLQRNDGSLAGRFNDRWEPAVSWSCLTGNAQTSIIWGKLYQITGDPKYLEAMGKANNSLKRCQILSNRNKDIHGGITGSMPIYGKYGRFEILNWATKFFIDALMLEMAIKGR